MDCVSAQLSVPSFLDKVQPTQQQTVDSGIKIRLCMSEAEQFASDRREEAYAELNKKTDYASACSGEASFGACTMKLIELNMAKANSLKSDYYISKYHECMSN